MKTPTHRLAREGIVLIPQGDSLFPGLSVRDNLDAGAFAPANWRKRAESRERVVEIFPRLGERMKQVVGTLSGGERRMCSIARGLMAEAHIYLVDEPSLGLAPGIAETIVRTLCESRSRRRRTRAGRAEPHARWRAASTASSASTPARSPASSPAPPVEEPA